MGNRKLEEAIDRVFQKLNKLSRQEFERKVVMHEDGEIANILRETRALEIQQLKGEVFADNFVEDNMAGLLDDLWGIHKGSPSVTYSGYDVASSVCRQLEIFSSQRHFTGMLQLQIGGESLSASLPASPDRIAAMNDELALAA